VIRNHFQRKLALFFTALVAVVQVAALAAVIVATNHNVRQQVTQELRVGSRVVARLLDSRSQQLLQTVRVLTADFGFKRALATGDGPTVRSALGNHAARIDADMGVVLGMDESVRVSTLDGLQPGEAFPPGRLLNQAFDTGEAVGFGLINERPYQLVIVPVRAPETIAWVCLGFALDAALARELASLTHTDISFEVHRGEQAQVLATSLAGDGAAAPAAASEARSEPASQTAVRMVSLGDERALVTSRPLATHAAYRLDAVLQKPVAAALEPYEPLRQRLILLASLALIVTAIGALWLARTVSRPVRQLLGAAERIATGDYTHPVGIRRRDELGSLAAAFERMQAAVREREDRITHQAYHDALTDLPNRNLLHERLQQAIARARASGEGRGVAVIVLNLNRFKEINDSLGHDVGDRILVTVAQQLGAALRPGETLARPGGDAFSIVAPCAGPDDALALAARFEAAWANPLAVGPMRLRVDRRLGVAVHPDHGDHVETLLRRAEMAVAAAKERDLALVPYEPGWDERKQHQLGLIADLGDAIDDGQLTLEYQPQIQLDSGARMHAEALVRWDHPRLGRIPPADFIPMAENAGYVRSLTRWVLAEVVRQGGAWHEAGRDLRLSANISARDLLDEHLPGFLAAELERRRWPADRLALEVTESAVMQNPTIALRVLHALRATGVRLAIDDFGTGHSSLAKLRRLPVDELKIDKSFILDLQPGDDDATAAAIVRSTIELGHNLGLAVVAEGVETPHARERLTTYGCDLAQGLLYSKPRPPQRLIAWLDAAPQDTESASP
jgi:diguanylate cyclase (GGDEF)-like protein